jgi:hypothetical protein
LRNGMQIVRHAEENPGIFAISRIDPEHREEILAIFNNSGETRQANIKTFSPPGEWERLFASPAEGFDFRAGAGRELFVQLPPISTLVLRNPLPIEPEPTEQSRLRVEANRSSEIDDRWEIKADLGADVIASVAFGVRAKGENEYKFLGTADSPPYRVFPTRDAVPNAPALEFKAISRDLFGRESTAECEWQRRVPKRPVPSR